VADRLQTLIFEIITRDHACAGLSAIGHSASGAAGNVDSLTRRLNEVGRKTAQARVALAGDREALARLDAIEARLVSLSRRTASPKLTVEGAARAIAEISALDVALDKVGGKGGAAQQATSSLGALSGTTGVSGMGALIGAGVVLSPVIATLGIGLAGFGAAAYGAIAPIEKAAQKTGGLQKNMHLLNPEQQQLATSILGLGRQYHQFEQQLQPEVLAVFGKGIQLAGHLMHDVQPVAQATGKALGGLLGQIDAEFASGTWQRFFGFMADRAGPDVKLLGNLFVQLADDLPPLLTQLQPLADGFLKDTTAILKLTGATTAAVAWEHQQADAVSHSTGWLGKLGHAAEQAFAQMFPGVKGAAALQKALDGAGSSAGRTGTAVAAGAAAFRGAWPAAQSYAQWVQAAATATANLMNAQDSALAAQLAYGNSLVTSANDAAALHTALKASGGAVGLQTQAQRNSFSAANTYIAGLASQAVQAYKSGHGVDAAMTAFRNGLPLLDSAKTTNKQYWQEVRTLVTWLNKLSLEKFIATAIHVTGSGQWSVTGTTITPGVAHGPQNIGAAPTSTGAAAGLYITGGRRGVDDQLIAAQRGELIVPVPMVDAGLVDHLRGLIPGFAAGGVAGSWSGAVKGLPPWTGGRLDATLGALASATANAALAAMRAAQAAARAAQGAAGAGGGPVSGDARAAQAYALSRFGMYGWSPAYDGPSLLSLWNRESGWNRFAYNAGSGATGIPQALPYTKMPRAAWLPSQGGQAAMGPQVNWGEDYIRGRYGSPSRAWAHEMAFNWYDDAGRTARYLPPGISLAGNRTGRPEPVGAAAGTTVIFQPGAVVIHAPAGNGRDIGRQLAEYLGAHVKGGGRIYPPGVTPR